jgi:DNA-directed RNA polymerase specialized sigma24 family protein
MSPEQARLDEYERERPPLHLLTPAERDAFEAVDMGEYGPREYARNTNRSPGTISNLLRRARDKLAGYDVEEGVDA